LVSTQPLTHPISTPALENYRDHVEPTDPSSTAGNSDEGQESEADLGGTDRVPAPPPRRHRTFHTYTRRHDNHEDEDDLTRSISRDYLEQAGYDPDEGNEGDCDDEKDEDRDSGEGEDDPNPDEGNEGDSDDEEDEDRDSGEGEDDYDQDAVDGLLQLKRSPPSSQVAGRKHLLSPQLEASSK
jgi:hypothetical protein